MYLAYSRGRFLYEIRPDVFPNGYLTDKEILLWERFYKDLKQDNKGIGKGKKK